MEVAKIFFGLTRFFMRFQTSCVEKVVASLHTGLKNPVHLAHFMIPVALWVLRSSSVHDVTWTLRRLHVRLRQAPSTR